MLWLANADLAAAVSNAGGLGVISPFACMAEDGDPVANLQIQIRRTAELTKRPFGVNIPLGLEECGLLLELAIRESAGIVITAAGDPEIYTPWLHKAGMKVLHVVSSVRQALSAETSGADAIIAEGCEAAGHIGFNETPLFSLLPQVVDAVSLPVVATGGICDARGVVAAMALGAEGVQMGTRFVAVAENPAHQRYKEALLEAGDADTVITSRRLVPTRSLNRGFTRKLLELETSGASAESIREFIGFRRSRRAQLDGDLNGGEAYCGTSVGLIHEILPVAELVKNILEGYQDIINGLGCSGVETSPSKPQGFSE